MPSEMTTNELIVVGLNHKTAPLHIRERLAFASEQKKELIQALYQTFVDGTVLLSTCNRVEFYGMTSTQGSLDAQVVKAFAEIAQLSHQDLQKHVYVHQGDGALKHLFRVASSLDSLIVGEPQILGQLKEALEESKTLQTSGHLNPLMEKAFLVARKVRSQTGIAKHVVSVSSVAVRLARHIFDDLGDRTALLIGAGEMGELAARHLRQDGVGKLLVANRSIDRAATLASELGGSPRTLDELPELLVTADIVIASTGARKPIITLPLAQAALKARKYRPLFIIDIAVPRNVEPQINELENFYVYDVDDLSQIADENKAQRALEAQAAEELIHEEVNKFHRVQAQKSLGPLLAEVRQSVHSLKEQELDWLLSKLNDSQQEKLIKQFADRLTNKLLHQVLSGLKTYAGSENEHQAVHIASTLFGIEQDAKDKSNQSQ